MSRICKMTIMTRDMNPLAMGAKTRCRHIPGICFIAPPQLLPPAATCGSEEKNAVTETKHARNPKHPFTCELDQDMGLSDCDTSQSYAEKTCVDFQPDR